MRTAIIIPARYGSTRLPGKPLLEIAGKSILRRVWELAQVATKDIANVTVLVATDDNRIIEHAHKFDMDCVLTSKNCHTGTERGLEAVSQLTFEPDFVVNLQGDTPFTPPHFIAALIKEANQNKAAQVITLAEQLSWQELDKLREHKKLSPFSGTTVILDQANNGVWFSKNIIPAIRNEEHLRQGSLLSPVYQHIGIYGYQYAMLQKYVSLSQSTYEQLEGLEQLRLLENGYPIKVVIVKHQSKIPLGGIDTLADLNRAEKLVMQYGE